MLVVGVVLILALLALRGARQSSPTTGAHTPLAGQSGSDPTPVTVTTQPLSSTATGSSPTATAATQATSQPAPTSVRTGAGSTAPAATATPAAPTNRAPAADYPQGGKYSTLEAVSSRGGRIVEVVAVDATTMNPVLANDTSSAARIGMMFNGLVGLNPDTGLPFADLATEVPTLDNGGISPDGLTYTFRLRRDVKWHDGQPFTARDVVYTYQTMMKKESGSPRASTLIDWIDSIAAPDDHTVVFKLKKIVASFIAGSAIYGIVPAHILEHVPADQLKSHPFSLGDAGVTIGTGPFKFKEWVRDDHATLVKNQDYFRGEPALDEYIFKVVEDRNQVVAQLKAGEADWGGIQKSFYEEMTRQQHLTTVAYDTYAFTYYAYNNDPASTELFQDKRVRQALLYALDREAMIKTIYAGLARVGVGTMPTVSWAYAPDQLPARYPYDPQRAEQLLDEAGWRKGPDGIRAKDGKRLSFTLWTNVGNSERAQYATLMQQQWKAIGVEATPRTEEWNAFLTRLDNHDYEVYLVGFSWGADPDQTAFWSCDAYTGGFNNFRYCNNRVDELLARGLSELDQAKRKQIYIDFQQIVADEVPVAILDFPQSAIAVNKRIKNLFPNAINPRWNAHTWFVTDGR